MLHKSIGPLEISDASTENTASEQYIIDAYAFSVNAYDHKKPLHLLALIAGIVCAGIIAQNFPSKEGLEQKPSCSSQYISYIQNLD